MPKNFSKILVFVLAWPVAVYVLIGANVDKILQFSPFVGMGIVGAIFANSTGAGGGVVFIPAFQWLAFTDQQSLATSIAIQCMGMTAGSLSWLAFAKKDTSNLEHWQPFVHVVFLCGALSVAGINFVHGMGIDSPGSLKQNFSFFSLGLGSLLLVSVLRVSSQSIKTKLTPADFVVVSLIGIFGGMITAWLSVGVGEILALYLLIRGFSATVSVAAAVCVSAISVWSAISYHVLANNVVWEVLAFAGPAAVIGGTVARYIAIWMPARALKIFFACWVLFMGLITSPLISGF
jgi:uncharacterized membrane protein YfcA